MTTYQPELKSKALKFLDLRLREATPAIVTAKVSKRGKGRPSYEEMPGLRILIEELIGMMPDADEVVQPPVFKDEDRKLRAEVCSLTHPGVLGPYNPPKVVLRIRATLLGCYVWKIPRSQVWDRMAERLEVSKAALIRNFYNYATKYEMDYNPYGHRLPTFGEFMDDLLARDIGADVADYPDGKIVMMRKATFSCLKGAGHETWQVSSHHLWYNRYGCPTCAQAG